MWRGAHGGGAADPPHFHPAMREDNNTGEPLPLTDYAEWRPSAHKKIAKRKAVEVEGQSQPIATSKRKRSLQEMQNTRVPLQAPRNEPLWLEQEHQPCGLIWDAVDHSCGYDATFTVLANVWLGNPPAWSPHFNSISPIMLMLSTLLSEVQQGSIGFEQARNQVQVHHIPEPNARFRFGVRGAGAAFERRTRKSDIQSIFDGFGAISGDIRALHSWDPWIFETKTWPPNMSLVLPNFTTHQKVDATW
ncbi:hypothetical protein C8F04DRAFT_1203793 [Mycena alexandri]|uniref:Uncharacterized protein n=1 Tax=Mycena alexandri TaxID=1745969 RepID=A0AAD6RVI4_9AGAR|nr:hypothetical protein C8F04DRAFT_1203793 [Mycena alexandri]